MIVKVQFDLDLRKLYNDNLDSYLMRDMSYDEYIVELKNLFGDNFERLSKDVYLEYVNDFQDLFNY